jgi:GT2 family glycosyltransferase
VNSEAVEKIKSLDNPSVSIIIPTLKTGQELEPLLKDIAGQSEKSVEVIIVRGVRPSGKARNMGAERSEGEYFLFFDDDIRLGNKDLIRNLLRILQEDEKVGLAGASMLIPLDATGFQRRIGMEVPRLISPLVNDMVESDLVTTQCWAQRRCDFERTGVFNEQLERGVDPEYRQRVRSLGFKIVIAPGTWTYHPPPENLSEFLKMNFRNGRSSAFAQKKYPELVVPVPDSGDTSDLKVKSFIQRIFASVGEILKALLNFRYLRLLERLSYSVGFIYGWLERD